MNRVHLEDYMSLTQKERCAHLDLHDPCLEIGASSGDNRALLAVFLNTTCHPLGMKTGHLCHACHNSKCSNVKHLYWGTAKENWKDNFDNKPNMYKKIAHDKKAKYGDDYFKKLGKSGKSGWQSNKPASLLTPEQVDARIQAVLNSGIDLQKYGWVNQVATLWGVSHTQVRRFFKAYWTGEKPYERSLAS
jgi:hypothetical protein